MLFQLVLISSQLYNSLIESKTKNIISTTQQNNNSPHSYEDHDKNYVDLAALDYSLT
jgi:hypothetical protein